MIQLTLQTHIIIINLGQLYTINTDNYFRFKKIKVEFRSLILKNKNQNLSENIFKPNHPNKYFLRKRKSLLFGRGFELGVGQGVVNGGRLGIATLQLRSPLKTKHKKAQTQTQTKGRKKKKGRVKKDEEYRWILALLRPISLARVPILAATRTNQTNKHCEYRIESN